MRLKHNPYFTSISIYMREKQCYLHVKKDENLAVKFITEQHLLPLGSSDRLKNHGILRIDGEENILRLINLLDEQKWLYKPIDESEPSANTSTDVRDQPLLASDELTKLAFTAVKNNDLLLLRILLGNEVTQQDREKLTQARIYMDEKYGEELASEFQREALYFQADEISAFISLSADEQKMINLQNQLIQCNRDAKEVVIGSKLVYFASSQYRPYLSDCHIDTFEDYEKWLTQQLDEYHPVLQIYSSNAHPKTIQKRIEYRLKSAITIADKLYDERTKRSLFYVNTDAIIQKKKKQFSALINTFLNDKDKLPAIFNHVPTDAKDKLHDMLLQHHINANARDEYGNTMLHYALLQAKLTADPSMVNLLLQFGADMEIKNHHGETPYEYCSINKSSIMIKLSASGKPLFSLVSRFMKDVRNKLSSWVEQAEQKKQIIGNRYFIFTVRDLTQNEVEKINSLAAQTAQALINALKTYREDGLLSVIEDGLKSNKWFFEPMRDCIEKFHEDASYGMYNTQAYLTPSLKPQH